MNHSFILVYFVHLSVLYPRITYLRFLIELVCEKILIVRSLFPLLLKRFSNCLPYVEKICFSIILWLKNGAFLPFAMYIFIFNTKTKCRLPANVSMAFLMFSCLVFLVSFSPVFQYRSVATLLLFFLLIHVHIKLFFEDFLGFYFFYLNSVFGILLYTVFESLKSVTTQSKHC